MSFVPSHLIKKKIAKQSLKLGIKTNSSSWLYQCLLSVRTHFTSKFQVLSLIQEELTVLMFIG